MDLLCRIEGFVSLLNEFCNKQMFLDDGIISYYERLVANQLVSNFQSIQDLNAGGRFAYQYGLSPLIKVATIPTDRAFSKGPNDHLSKAINATDFAINYKNGSFYLFGSVASGDSIQGWSDIDSMLLIDHEVLASVDALLDLRNKLLIVNENLKILDPLQHHGVFIMPRLFLEFYSDSFIPIDNLGPILTKCNDSIMFRRIQTGKTFQKLNGLLCNIESCCLAGVMKHHPFKGEFLLADYANSNNCMYQLKYYLGLFTILPSLVAGLRGQNSYKPIAIELLKEKLDGRSKDWLHRISQLRINWDAKNNFNYIKKNCVPPQVYEYIPSNYFELGAAFVRQIRNTVVNDIPS